MKKSILITTISLLAISFCTSCGTVKEGNIEITDLTNRTITVPYNPSRVVCIGAGMLRLYTYVIGTDNIVAVEDIEKSDTAFNGVIRPYREINKELYATLPSCGKGGPSNQAAEPEVLAKCAPDIVLSMYSDEGLADILQGQLNVPVVAFSYGGANPFSDSVKQSISLLGKIFGKEERASTLVNYIDTIKSDLNDRTKDVADADKLTVYLGCLGNFGMQDITSSCKKYPLFEASNIKNAIDDGGSGYVTVDKEALVSMDMDKMILDAGGLMNKFKATYTTDPTTYDKIKAIKNDQVYVQMPYNAYYTNIEVALMDAYYCAIVAYPTLFSDIDIVTKSNEISQIFLGQEYYETIAAKSYGGFQHFSIPDDFA